MVYTMIDSAGQALQDSNTGISSLHEALASVEDRLSALQIRNGASSKELDAELRAGLGAMQGQLATLDGSLASMKEFMVSLQEQFSSLQSKLSGLEGAFGEASGLLAESQADLSSLETRLHILEQQLPLKQQRDPSDARMQGRLQGLEQLVEQNRQLALRQERQIAALAVQVNDSSRSGRRSAGLFPADTDRFDPPKPQIQRRFVALLAGAVAAAGLATLAAQLPRLRGAVGAVDDTTQAETKGEDSSNRSDVQAGGRKDLEMESQQLKGLWGSNSTALPASTTTAHASVGAPPENRLKMFCPQRCWVEVSGSQGSGSLYQGLLKGPASFPLGKGLRVSSGRADILKVRVNDGPVSLLDGKRQVSSRLFLPPASRHTSPPAPQPARARG